MINTRINRLSLPDLSSLDPFAQSIPDSTPANDVVVENIPENTQTRMVVAPENDLLEGFKHSERQVDIADIDHMEEKEADIYLEKIRNFDGDFPGDIYLS